MNMSFNTEAGATSGSPRLSWRETGGISGAACVQKSSSEGEKVQRPDSARRSGDPACEGSGAKGPAGGTPGLDK